MKGIVIVATAVTGAALYLLLRGNGKAEGRPAPSGGLGDIDGDGRITQNDYDLMREIITMKIPLTPELLAVADLTGDGKVSVLDLGWLRSYMLGQTDTFPIQEVA